MRFAFHPLFFQEIEDQRQYYNEKEVGLGDEFVGEVDATLDKIQGDALLFRPVYRNVRRWRLSRFKKFSVRNTGDEIKRTDSFAFAWVWVAD